MYLYMYSSQAYIISVHVCTSIPYCQTSSSSSSSSNGSGGSIYIYILCVCLWIYRSTTSQQPWFLAPLPTRHSRERTNQRLPKEHAVEAEDGIGVVASKGGGDAVPNEWDAMVGLWTWVCASPQGDRRSSSSDGWNQQAPRISTRSIAIHRWLR